MIILALGSGGLAAVELGAKDFMFRALGWLLVA